MSIFKRKVPEKPQPMLPAPSIDSPFDIALKSVGLVKNGSGQSETWVPGEGYRQTVKVVEDFPSFVAESAETVDIAAVTPDTPLVMMRIPETDSTQVSSIRDARRLTVSAKSAVDSFMGPLINRSRASTDNVLARADAVANKALTSGGGAEQLRVAGEAADIMMEFLSRTMTQGGNYPLTKHAERLAAEKGVPVGLVLHEFNARRTEASIEKDRLNWQKESAAKFDAKKREVNVKIGELISLFGQADSDGVELKPSVENQIARMGIKSRVSVARRAERSALKKPIG